MNVEQLKNRDYTLIVDKSGSMATTDTTAGTRWQAAFEAAQGLARKMSEFDPDGITLYAFANNFKRHENVTPVAIENVWKEHEPNGGTNLSAVLKDAFQSYFYRKERGQTKPNGETIVVLTDGVPDNASEVANEIIRTTQKMERDEELAVSFIQIGRDATATAYLKSLDDGLQGKGAKFDIVDTLTVEEMGDKTLTDVLLSAITD